MAKDGFAEVVQNRVGMNASQMNLANTGIGSFNDRVREGAVGGTPFGDPREQGFATGLLDRANMAQGNDDVSRKYRMMEDGEKIIAASAGNLAVRVHEQAWRRDATEKRGLRELKRCLRRRTERNG